MENENLQEEKTQGNKNKNKKIILFFSCFLVFVFIASILYFLDIKSLLNPKTFIVDPNKTNNQIVEEVEDIFSGFSKLEIDYSNVEDNFSLEALDNDATGVSVDSSYVLKSKEELTSDVIKDYLKIRPEVAYVLSEVSEKEWKIEPKESLEANKQVNITLDASYTDQSGEKQQKNYSWVFQTRDDFQVISSIPRNEGVGVPINSGIEITFSHEHFSDYENYFSIEPSVAGVFEVHDRTLVFAPKDPLNFKSIYRVKVKKGFGVKGSDNVLKEDYVFEFETERQKDSFVHNNYNIYTRAIEIDDKTEPLVRVYASNKNDAFLVSVYKFFDYQGYLDSLKEKDKLPYWSYSKEDFLYDVSGLKQVFSAELKIQTNNNTYYLVFPEKLDNGYYIAEISRGGKRTQVNIQVSNLAVYSSLTKTDTITWVNSTENGRNVSGAEVSILGVGGSYKTNSKGLAVFKTPQAVIENGQNSNPLKAYYLKVSKDDDSILLPASKMYRSFYWQRPSLADDYWIYMYTDRPRYQSNDVIKYWGFLQDREEKDIDQKIKVSLYKSGYVDYYYRPIRMIEKEVSLDENNTYTGEIVLDNIKPDYYTLELSLDDRVIKTKYISVKPYIKPAYNISLSVDKDQAYAGEMVNYKASVSFFEGTPVPNLDVVFSDPENKEHVATTNDKGEAEFSFTQQYSDCTREYGCWPKYTNSSVRPQNSELAEISDSANVRFFGPKVFIRKKVTYPEEGKAELEIKAYKYDLEKEKQYNWWEVGDESELLPNVKVTADIIKITYTKRETGTHYDYINKKTYKSYTYDKKTEKINSFEARTDSNGVYKFQQDVEPNTSYQIKLKYYDQDGRYDNDNTYFYYYNGKNLYSYGGWRYNYYHLKVKPKEDDSTIFSVGEKVELEFLNGDELLEDRDNSYLYMQLRNGLLGHELTGSSEYEFIFNKDDIPNINLAGVYFNGKTYVTTNYGYSRSVSYDTKDSRLKIMVETDKEKYKPGEDVELNLKVLDKDDRPVKAEVNLNLVDEAYYAIASDQATPLETLYKNIGPGILLTESTHEALEASDSMAEKGGCFVKGTKVLMADKTEKPIEDVQVGDRVLTFSNPFDNDLVEGRVAKTWEHQAREYLLINAELKVTPEHPMYSNYRFVDAGLLKEGDWLLNDEGDKIIVKSIEIIFDDVLVYNLQIDPQHTYIAGGFYVHNQEKGGGAREFFTDAALFQSVKTDSQGRAETAFKLPDNITSWRITAQAISANLDAGVSVTNLPVSLPVFADITIGDEYLLDDSPMVKMRAFGESLVSGDEVSFNISSAEKLFDPQENIKSRAFTPTFFDIPKLSFGKHHLSYGLETEKGNDAIKLPIDIISSRLTIQKAKREKLEVGTKITAPNDKDFVVAIMDEGQNTLYDPLLRLSWQWGDRVDQVISRKIAREMLEKYYDLEYQLPDFVADNYQLNNGGVSLLPYSSDEVELSMQMALLGLGEFDEEALAQYFYKRLQNDYSSREVITYSLCALVQLEKPVLLKIEEWLKRDDLSVFEKLYIAIALAKVGDYDTARGLYQEIMSEYAEEKTPHIIIRVDGGNDKVFKATILTSVLGAYLGDKKSDQMFDYVINNQILYGPRKNSENLYNIEKIDYIKTKIKSLKPSPVKVKIELSGKEEEITLTGGKIYSLGLNSVQAQELKFLEVTGDAGLSIIYTVDALEDEIVKDDSIGIERKFFVDGKETNEFKEKDLIEVRLYPRIGSGALSGSYQITDILPSGFKPVTKLYYRNRSYDCQYWYPYNTEGQKVKYMISKTWKRSYCGGNYFKYFARVKNLGEYVSESAVIQSFVNPEFVNFSDKQYIKIVK